MSTRDGPQDHDTIQRSHFCKSWDEVAQEGPTISVIGFERSPLQLTNLDVDSQTGYPKLHSGIMGLYRRVAVGHYGIETRTWPDEKIQAQLELPQPLDWLHVYRLRYAQHSVTRKWGLDAGGGRCVLGGPFFSMAEIG